MAPPGARRRLCAKRPFTFAKASTRSARPGVEDGGDTTAEIEQILAAARRNNRQNGVTGTRLYRDGCFAQVRGPLTAVEAIFETIECDPRHRDVTVLHFKPIDQRSFGNWSMAYAGRPNPQTCSFDIRGAMASPDSIQGEKAGQDLVTILRDLIGRHEDAFNGEGASACCVSARNCTQSRRGQTLS